MMNNRTTHKTDQYLESATESAPVSSKFQISKYYHQLIKGRKYLESVTSQQQIRKKRTKSNFASVITQLLIQGPPKRL